MEDVRSARLIEDVRALEKVRKRLAVLAIADEAETGIRRNVVCDPAHVTAPAAQCESLRVERHDL
jgi:hypothetical protein